MTKTADRMPPLSSDEQSPAERDGAERFQALRGQPVFGPFAALHRSPELMLRVAAIGEFTRKSLCFGVKLSEIAILSVARAYDQRVEWAIHSEIAAKAGLSAEIIDAIAEGRRPSRMDADETLIYDCVVEIERGRRLSDPSYAALKARFGDQGVVELAALIGYYQLLATVMNVARTEPPEGPVLPLRH